MQGAPVSGDGRGVCSTERHVLRNGKSRWLLVPLFIGMTLVGASMAVSPWVAPQPDIDVSGVVLGALIAASSLVVLVRTFRARLELEGGVLTAFQMFSVRRYEFTGDERPVLSVTGTYWGCCPAVESGGQRRSVSDIDLWGRKDRERLERYVELVNGYNPNQPLHRLDESPGT